MEGPAAATAAIRNLGCRVNQAEMDAVARALAGRGVRLVDHDRRADLYVVNTCTVTHVADQKSRQAVRRARRTNPGARIVVTGCAVQVAPDVFRAIDPAAHLVDNRARDRLVEELTALAGVVAPAPGHAIADGALPTLSGVEPIAGVADGRAEDLRTRAFVKVQDGCSFHCTYCLIPAARGPERSIPADDVIAEVRRARARGHREAVLTGINIGTYDGGRSLPGPRGTRLDAAETLAGLVRRILAETDVERLRLSSIEPQHVDDEFLRAWLDGAPRTMPHLHLPLQSGDDGVLRRMGRRYDGAFYAALVERLRRAIPDVAIHADLIAGFPTEDEAAWRRTVDFLRAIDPAGLHVFRYSGRPGTPALRMAGRVPEATRRTRAEEALALAAEGRTRFARRFLGRTLPVLVESRSSGARWTGLSPHYVRVDVAAEGTLANRIVDVRIAAAAGERLAGEPAGTPVGAA